MTGSSRRRPISNAELVERIAAGESSRSVGRETCYAHTTLGRRLRRPEGASELCAAELRRRLEKKRRSAEQAKERPLERELRRQSRERAARDSQLNAGGLSSRDRFSRNDELAAEAVTAGGGVEELIEATGLPTRLNVYESVDPQIVVAALGNDGRRAVRDWRDAGKSWGRPPDLELIRRRAAGETFRRLAEDYAVSHSTLSRFFARPDVAKELRAQQRERKKQQRTAAGPDDSGQAPDTAALLAAHYASKISDIWCPIHSRRTYVTSVDTSEREIRLNVAGCCPEAAEELLRWLKIYRPRLPRAS